MADFPTTPHTFTDFANGATTDAAQVTDIYEEVEAIEAGYLQGTARLNSSNSTVANLSVLGGSTLTGAITASTTLSLTGPLVLTGSLRVSRQSTTLSGGSTRFDNVVVASSAVMIYVESNSTAVAITGISGGVDGRVLVVVNNQSGVVLTLNESDANSSADCRMSFSSNTTKGLNANASILLVYHGGTSLWKGISL